ncbi:MAG: nucleotidyl transferase AbiEii/AbiGii toxin family protein [Sphingobacteriaceae bacterium]|nr:nucleotidyl transferase AbiEii/AbiGii toxin family protein [Sphingobacteriaceae bacterium]
MATEFFMYNRPRHQAIDKILKSFNSAALRNANCYFAGGTAISLLLDEFRESVDIDFLCSSAEGYRFIRNVVSSNSLGELVSEPIKYLREIRTDRDKVSTFVESDGIPVKIEIVREGRIEIHGEYDNKMMIPLLSKEDLFAQKLLANADRGLDRQSKSRDIIDISAMLEGWGEIPDISWNKAVNAYGNQIAYHLAKSVQLIHDRDHLRDCIIALDMDEEWLVKAPRILKSAMKDLENKGVIFPEIDMELHRNKCL